MLHGGAIGALELRRSQDGGVQLSGRFPYNSRAVLSDGGRTGKPRKEEFLPGSFSYSIESPDQEINLLVGHEFAKPLASKLNGSLTFNDTKTALNFTAIIAAAVAETSHAKDAIALISSGLAVGISPGFRAVPRRAVPDPEEIIEEPNDGSLDEQGQPRRGAIIRRIKQAILFELSIVTRPAYPDATVEMRNWTPTDGGIYRKMHLWV